ncbi:IS3 family transposase [Pantoea cypripedii]|uniref:IS3 family transposase n=1 Tax=Pantoea cypripedii TaxID=55209 RepID=UPI002FC5CF12
MSSRKHSPEFKKQAVLHFLTSGDSSGKTSKLFGVNTGLLCRWAELWKAIGDSAFSKPAKKQNFTPEFKESVILHMWQNNASARKTAPYFGIRDPGKLSQWEKLYLEGGIMALHRKKTSRCPVSGKKKTPGNQVTAPHPVFRSQEEELEYLRAEVAYPKKASGVEAGRKEPETLIKTRVVDALCHRFSLAMLLVIAGLARSTFYYQRKLLRNPVDRHASVKERITGLFHYHKGRYGYRRITAALRNDGMPVNHKTVGKLMRELKLASNLRPKKYQSWKGPCGHISANVMQRNFQASEPNQKWVSDVTEFSLGGGKVYLSPLMDLFNREIVAWNLSTKPDFGLVAGMLDDGLRQLNKDEHPVLHTDRGWQYQHRQWKMKLSAHGVIRSMSRPGNCLDNAAMESFFGLLKTECWHHEKYSDVDELKKAIGSWIHYYNHERIKTGLGGLSPVQYRTQYQQTIL